MKKTFWFGLVLFAFATNVAAPLWAQQSSARNTITLYSPLKYNHDQSRATLDFERAAYPPRPRHGDVGYGFLRAGDDFDWFQSGGGPNSRTVIRDLGTYAWTDTFTIPVVEPLPKLKPGEQRQIGIDTSGADGEDGAPGADADGVVRPRPKPSVAPPRPKREGKPKIDPIFVKAVVGHMYVIHVVDESRDFYALFRVEALERGDYCTVSWKMIPDPSQQTGQTASR